MAAPNGDYLDASFPPNDDDPPIREYIPHRESRTRRIRRRLTAQELFMVLFLEAKALETTLTEATLKETLTWASAHLGKVPELLGLGGKLLGKAAALALRQRSGLQGCLDGHQSLVLADSGSERNIMREDYARRRGYTIDNSPQTRTKVKLPQNGKYLHIIGRTTASWAFEENRSQVYRLDFDVVSNCVHDLIIGNQFLDQTKTLTEYKHRLVAMPPRFPGRNRLSINSIGASHQTLPMLVRGDWGGEIRADCLPDTGAEGEVISEAFVRKNKLRLEHSDTTFEFADGTTDDSLGRVYLDMSFENEPDKRISTYFEVMRGSQYDIILSHQFVFQHRIFSDKVHSFVNVIGKLGLNVISFLRGWKKDTGTVYEASLIVRWLTRTQTQRFCRHGTS